MSCSVNGARPASPPSNQIAGKVAAAVLRRVHCTMIEEFHHLEDLHKRTPQLATGRIGLHWLASLVHLSDAMAICQTNASTRASRSLFKWVCTAVGSLLRFPAALLQWPPFLERPMIAGS